MESMGNRGLAVCKDTASHKNELKSKISWFLKVTLFDGLRALIPPSQAMQDYKNCSISS